MSNTITEYVSDSTGLCLVKITFESLNLYAPHRVAIRRVKEEIQRDISAFESRTTRHRESARKDAEIRKDIESVKDGMASIRRFISQINKEIVE